MNGFVPGALAIIVGPPCPDNGKIVELIKRPALMEDVGEKRVFAGSATCWLVKSLSGPILARTGDKIVANVISVVEQYRLKIIGNPTGKDETLEWMPSPIIKLEEMT